MIKQYRYSDLALISVLLEKDTMKQTKCRYTGLTVSLLEREI